MKGVILAGGRATRLHPLTLVTNKHLLPVYNKPVIYYAIEKLVHAGIDRIMIVTSPEFIENFVHLLGSGQNFISERNGKQVQIVYGIQNEPSGIADGLYIAKEYVGQDDCILYLGDNILEDDLSGYVKKFSGGAGVFLKEVSDPRGFGVAVLGENGKVVRIDEKPLSPTSRLAAIGVYMYDNTVFEKMIGQQKSARGEFEITDINNKYIQEGKMDSVILTGAWFDVGTMDSLLEASVYMKKKNEKNQS